MSAKPEPFTDEQFEALRQSLTAHGDAGPDTIHAGGAAMFERLFATVDDRLEIARLGRTGWYSFQVPDPGTDRYAFLMVGRGKKTQRLGQVLMKFSRELFEHVGSDVFIAQEIRHATQFFKEKPRKP